MALVITDTNSTGQTPSMEPLQDSTGKLQTLNLENEKTISAEQRAMSFRSVHPFFVRKMKYSQVNPGYWMGLPKGFCQAHLPPGTLKMMLVDHKEKEHEVKFLGHKTALSGGWGIFSVAHELKVDDVVVFELVEPSKFKVHIYREPRTNLGVTTIMKPKKSSNKTEKKVVSMKKDREIKQLKKPSITKVEGVVLKKKGGLKKSNYPSTAEVGRVVLEEKGGGGEGDVIFDLVELSKFTVHIDKKLRTNIDNVGIKKNEKPSIKNGEIVISKKKGDGGITKSKNPSTTNDEVGIMKSNNPSTTKVEMVVSEEGGDSLMMKLNYPSIAEVENVVSEEKGGKEGGEGSVVFELVEPSKFNGQIYKEPRTNLGVTAIMKPKKSSSKNEKRVVSMKKGGGGIKQLKKPSTTQVKGVVVKKKGGGDGLIKSNISSTAVVERISEENDGGGDNAQPKSNNPSIAEVERVVSEEKGVADSDIPIAKYSLQCRKCFKWRVIRSVKEFEEIRGILIENPFVCEMKPNVSCDVLDDIPLYSSLPKTLKKKNKKRKSEGTTGEVNFKQTVKRKRKVVKSCAE